MESAVLQRQVQAPVGGIQITFHQSVRFNRDLSVRTDLQVCSRTDIEGQRCAQIPGDRQAAGGLCQTVSGVRLYASNLEGPERLLSGDGSTDQNDSKFSVQRVQTQQLFCNRGNDGKNGGMEITAVIYNMERTSSEGDTRPIAQSPQQTAHKTEYVIQRKDAEQYITLAAGKHGLPAPCARKKCPCGQDDGFGTVCGTGSEEQDMSFFVPVIARVISGLLPEGKQWKKCFTDLSFYIFRRTLIDQQHIISADDISKDPDNGLWRMICPDYLAYRLCRVNLRIQIMEGQNDLVIPRCIDQGGVRAVLPTVC